MPQKFKEYFSQAVYLAKIDSLIELYRSRGFEVMTETLSGLPFQFDLLMVNKDGKGIAFEIKVGSPSKFSNKEFKERIQNIGRLANKLGFEFRVVFVVPPATETIEIPWLYEAFTSFMFENPPDEITELASRTYTEGTDLEIRGVSIADGEIKVLATGYINFSVQFGNEDGDYESRYHDAFEFEGEIVLDVTEQTVLSVNLKIDDSGWGPQEGEDE